MLGSFLSIFTVPTTLALVVGGFGAAPATPGAATIAPPTSTVARSTPRLNTDFILFSPVRKPSASTKGQSPGQAGRKRAVRRKARPGGASPVSRRRAGSGRARLGSTRTRARRGPTGTSPISVVRGGRGVDDVG